MKRALLVIDVQNEYFTGAMPISDREESLNNIVKAIEASYKKDIKVVLIQHTAPQKDSKTFVKGSTEWDIHPAIAGMHFDHRIEKNLPGSFTNTDLEAWIRNQGIDTLVICGYMTQMCCDTTARQGVHLGFSVEFLSDGTGTLDVSNNAGTIKAEALHKAILITQAMRFSKVLTTEEWIKGL